MINIINKVGVTDTCRLAHFKTHSLEKDMATHSSINPMDRGAWQAT